MMDSLQSSMIINTTLLPSHLKLGINLPSGWYEGILLANKAFQLKDVAELLNNKQFNVSNWNQEELIIQLSVLKITLYNSLSKRWRVQGKFKNLEETMELYPPTEYIYGVKYNSNEVQEVKITRWNRGTRIYTLHKNPHGDNAASFHAGRAMWTKDTDDAESKGQFYHRYINSNFEPCCGSNGVSDLDVYLRKI